MTELSRWCAWLSACAMLTAWILVAVLGDLVWWTLPLVYGPRWITALFFAGLIPALLFSTRTALKAGLLMAPVFVFGLIDFRVPYGSLEPSAEVALRVMELNAGGTVRSQREANVSAIIAEIARSQPQLIVIAECRPDIADAIRAEGSWFIERSKTNLCFASRWPLLEWQVRDPADFWKMGGSGAIARALVAGPAGLLRVGLVHLETPRNALEKYMDLSRIPTLGDVTRQNIAQRELESRVAREWIFDGERLPTIVAGDFNLPVESAIYRRHWADLRNAFSRSGWGTGPSKQTSFWGSRIDHILTTPDIVTTKAWTVNGSAASDHVPVFADLSLAVNAAAD